MYAEGRKCNERREREYMFVLQDENMAMYINGGTHYAYYEHKSLTIMYIILVTNYV